jgi:hypothetical protein
VRYILLNSRLNSKLPPYRAGRRPTANGRSGIGMLSYIYNKDGMLGLWRGSHLLVARGALMSSAQLAAYETLPFLHYIFVTFGQVRPEQARVTRRGL